METCEYAGVDLHARQSGKRKRFDDTDDCVPAKRPLTEEAMAAFMHQLNLSNSPASLPSPYSPFNPAPLNITAVTSCPATSTEDTCHPNEEAMRGSTPAHSTHSSRACGRLTPPKTTGSQRGTRPQGVGGSYVTEGLDLATTTHPFSHHPVHIRVTPATPPSSESSGSPSQEDYEPMEQVCLFSSRLHSRQNKNRVVLEDISSDSSDSEMSQRVWIAPELQSLTASQRQILPPPLLDEIAKNGMAVVPWVEREQYLTSFLSRANMACTESVCSSDSDEEEGFQLNGHKQQREYAMHS